MGRRRFDPRQFGHIPQSVRNPKASEVLFGVKLVEAMDWIEKDIGGFYYTRGNLRTEADSVPDDVKKDWTYVDQYRSWAELWNYSTSLTRRRFEGVCPRVRHKYDAGQSMVTGNQVTDLLREIPHDPTKMYYEPKHSLYLAVHVEVMDIIETQLADNDGSLVDFALGMTTLTLHFKYE